MGLKMRSDVCLLLHMYSAPSTSKDPIYPTSREFSPGRKIMKTLRLLCLRVENGPSSCPKSREPHPLLVYHTNARGLLLSGRGVFHIGQLEMMISLRIYSQQPAIQSLTTNLIVYLPKKKMSLGDELFHHAKSYTKWTERRPKAPTLQIK